jgi:hypothetical protein
MKGLEPVDYANRLHILIKKTDRGAWQKGTPVDWANESHRLAQKFAYKDAQGNDLEPNSFPNLDQAYVTSRVDVVAAQLQKGGVRLAQVLNEAFGK